MANRIIDLTGQRFGRLLVLGLAPPRSSNGSRFWMCRCDCGTEKSISGPILRRKDVVSCGCFLRGARLPAGEAAFNELIAAYRAGARVREIDWQLTNDAFAHLTAQPCHYCGQPPEHVRKSTAGYSSYVYNGIDRVNNAVGYVDGNCVACCKICNYAKRSLTEFEFYSWLQRIALKAPWNRQHEAITEYDKKVMGAVIRKGIAARRARGERVGALPKLSPDQEAQVVEMRQWGARQRVIAARFAVSTATISRILKKHGLGRAIVLSRIA